MNYIEKKHLEAIEDIGSDWCFETGDDVLTDYFDKKSASSKSAEITEEIAVEFVEWLTKRESPYSIMYGESPKRLSTLDKDFTIKEVYEEFLKTKINEE